MPPPDPFRLEPSTLPGWRGRVLSLVQPAAERALALPELGARYADVASRTPAEEFPSRALENLGIRLSLDADALARIPSTGPLVIVANHPFGALDGLALLALLQRVRSDVRLLANEVLGRIPALAGRCIFVDVFGEGSGAAGRNAGSMRQALRWLRDGGAVAVFPSGEVAHVPAGGGAVADPAWQPAAAELALRAGAVTVPVAFEGANSRLFRMAGRLHPRARTLLLPRELLRQRGRTVPVHVGTPVAADRLARMSDAAERIGYLRFRTYALLAGAPAGSRASAKIEAPVAPAGDRDALAADVAALPAERCLVASGAYRVFVASAAELPAILPEIGRLREIAFRDVGEGTGLARDLDRFDRSYQHLFLWHAERREVVGAYRVGATDVVTAAHGPAGLYTQTLFRYGRRLLEEIGPALELGRSFVRPESQRDYGALLLLWKGIGRLVVRDMRYRCLFGPVSVSARYESLSRQLLMRFLYATRLNALSRLVRPRRPPRREAPALGHLAPRIVSSLDEVSALLEEIERDGKGMPVLLRQYLKLNAELLGFSVDPAFGDVLDGLMLVDLTRVEPAVLGRYLGREEARQFLVRHGAAGAAPRRHGAA